MSRPSGAGQPPSIRRSVWWHCRKLYFGRGVERRRAKFGPSTSLLVVVCSGMGRIIRREVAQVQDQRAIINSERPCATLLIWLLEISVPKSEAVDRVSFSHERYRDSIDAQRKANGSTVQLRSNRIKPTDNSKIGEIQGAAVEGDPTLWPIGDNFNLCKAASGENPPGSALPVVRLAVGGGGRDCNNQF